MTSMRALVTAVVLQRGDSTLDDLQSIFPRISRVHLGNALYQAVSGRHIRVVQRGISGKGVPAIWGAPLPRTEGMHLVRSVFDLGEKPVWRGPWPPATAHATRHQPLGDWNAE